MAKVKCSDLSQAIYDLVVAVSIDPRVSDLNDAIAIMRERLPELDRNRVVDSIVEATTSHIAIIAETKRTLDALKREAKQDRGLRESIKEFNSAIQKLEKPPSRESKKELPPGVIRNLQAEKKKLKAQVDAIESPDGLKKLAREYAKQFVEQGYSDREALLTAVHNELSTVFPNITRRTAMDAISGYGDFSPLSTEEVDVVLRDLKGQMQQLGKLEDMKAGHAPKRSGNERREISDAERVLLSQVAEKKKEGGFQSVDPAAELKSALGSIKTRLKNQVTDLEKQIATRTKIVRNRKPSPSDAEVVELRKRRDKLKEEFEGIFSRGMSDQQRIENAKLATQKAIDEYERRLRERDFSKRRHHATPETPELAALRANRDALRAKYDAENPNPPNVVRMRVRLAELESHLASGTLPTPEPSLRSESAEAARLRESLDSIRKALGNSEPAIKERYLEQIASYQQRLAESDFAPPAPKVENPQSKELARLEYERDRLRRSVQVRIRNMKPKSIWQRVGDPLNMARAVMTSGEFSGVLRQGGFVAIANPLLASKSIIPMLKAFASPAYSHQIEQEILHRPNAPLYYRAGLYLSTEDAAFTQMEEAYMTTWLDRLKGKVKWDPVNASADAYKTFLNKLRADKFDSMQQSLGIGREFTLEEAETAAHFINVATGRGDLGPAEQAGVALNTIFFAPRYVASRFQLLIAPFTGMRYYGKSPTVRKVIAREYAKYMLGVGTIYALSLLAMDDEEDGITFDARSSDFGKIRFGSTRIDPLSGLAQVTTLVGRTLSGESKTQGGEIVPLRGSEVGYGQRDLEQVWSKFLRYKLSPAVSVPSNLLLGEDPLDRQVSAGDVATSTVTPITYSDIYDAFQEHDVAPATAMTLLAMLGMGIQVHRDKDKD